MNTKYLTGGRTWRRDWLRTCVGLGAAGVLSAAESKEVTIERDLVYAELPGGRELKVDVYLPPSSFGPTLPSVIYIHGGGWAAGDKSEFAKPAEWMASRGYVGVCIEYRLVEEAIWPAQIDDVKAAIRWLRANGKKYRASRRQIGLAGSSAGAHLAVLAGFTPKIEAFGDQIINKKQRTDVRAVAAFAPALDFNAFPEDARAYAAITKMLGVTRQERPKLWTRASPVSYVVEGLPATLLLHGTDDEIVPHQQSAGLLDELLAARVRARLFSAPGAGHGFFGTEEWYRPALGAMFGFFEDTLL